MGRAIRVGLIAAGVAAFGMMTGGLVAQGGQGNPAGARASPSAVEKPIDEIT